MDTINKHEKGYYSFGVFISANQLENNPGFPAGVIISILRKFVEY
jgi:hypothetical protein